MKPVKTKAELRAEIDSQVDAFLAHGGKVATFDPGQSGRTDNSPLARPPQLERSEQSRTPVLSEIQAIEARRQKPARPARKSGERKRRSQEDKKALLTDDFGEPLRWIPE